jgi:hypothetical protein
MLDDGVPIAGKADAESAIVAFRKPETIFLPHVHGAACEVRAAG